MNAQKLFNAAKIIAGSQPTLSNELTRIAQDISGFTPDPLSPMPAETNQLDFNPDNNPDIKNFANPATKEDKVTHKITLTISAPKGLGELEVMNEVLPVINQIKDKDGIELKGYQFTQS
jgi:hypothetical protein